MVVCIYIYTHISALANACVHGRNHPKDAMLPVGKVGKVGKAELVAPQGSPLGSSPCPSDDELQHAPCIGRQASEAGLRSMASLGCCRVTLG